MPLPVIAARAQARQHHSLQQAHADQAKADEHDHMIAAVQDAHPQRSK